MFTVFGQYINLILILKSGNYKYKYNDHTNNYSIVMR